MARFEPKKYGGGSDTSPTAQENRVASRLGGKRVVGSGASMFSKADVRSVKANIGSESLEFLVECKQTIHKSLSIKWDWLKKISAEADAQQCEPALTIEIKGGESDALTDRDWVLLPARVFRKLKDGE